MKKRFAKSNQGGLRKAIDGKILEVSARHGDVAARLSSSVTARTVRHLAGVGPLAEATGTSHRQFPSPRLCLGACAS